MQTAAVVLSLALVAALVAPIVARRRRRRGFSTAEERVCFQALHPASQAAPPRRVGLIRTSAARSAKQFRDLLGAPAVAITGPAGLAWAGSGRAPRRRPGAGRRRTAADRPPGDQCVRRPDLPRPGPLPGSGRRFGLRLPWLPLGLLAYPFLSAVERIYPRPAERTERDLAEFVDGG